MAALIQGGYFFLQFPNFVNIYYFNLLADIKYISIFDQDNQADSYIYQ